MTALNNRNQYANGSAGADDTGRSGLFFLLVGAGIGAVTALLLAPKSGAAMRGDLTGLAQRGYDQTTDMARRVKDQSAGLYQTVREKAGDVLDLASSQAAGAQNAAGEAVDAADDKVSAAIHQLEEKYAKKDSNTADASSGVV